MQTFHFLSTSFSHLHPSPRCSEATRSTQWSPSAPDLCFSLSILYFFHPHTYVDNGALSNALSKVQPLCEYPTFYSISLFLCIHQQTSNPGSIDLLKFCLCLGYSRFWRKSSNIQTEPQKSLWPTVRTALSKKCGNISMVFKSFSSPPIQRKI